ncbi:MAG TPA: zinc metalloprotease HtpX [Gemmatimonadaceae bacterium]|jgi:heat shock protein HtpX|nr:zinc metalloprotease HtpX [Gemmatimonadaceae bacterium]
MNNVKVFTLMAALTGLLVALGGYFGGQGGMVTMLIVSALMNFVMYFASTSMVLRMYRARVVDASQAPELYGMVDRLRQRAGLPMPLVAIAPHEQPNAFATGRSPEKSVVCVTAGLMKLIGTEELEGVIAHELAHIKNRDMLLQTIAATMAGAISNLAYMAMFFGGRDDDNANPLASIVMIVVAPLAAMMIQFAISRQREFKADAVGAQITGRPMALASALQKLDAYSRRIPMHVAPAAAPLAQVNPLAASGSGMMKLFSTHPATEERVNRLRALAVA